MARGGLVKRGRKWTAVIPLGRDPAAGRKRQRWITLGATTREEAETELTGLMAQHFAGTLPEAPATLTVAQRLERWFEHAKTTVGGTTWERYAVIVHSYLIPALGHHRLVKLTPLQVQGAYDAMLRAGRGRGEGGLSARSVRQTHAVLHRALAMTVRWNLLGRNVADAVEPPRLVQREIRPLEEEATVRLLAAARGTRWELPLLLGATTGMRRGDVLALRWGDVDVDRGLLVVARSAEQTKAGLVFKSPKSGKARVVALPALAIEALTRHKARAEPAPTPTDLILAQGDGRPWRLLTFTQGLRRWLRRAGFRGLRFHDLRHGHASHLLRQRIPLKVVSERLGHSTIAITADLYQQVLEGMDREAADALDVALRPR